MTQQMHVSNVVQIDAITHFAVLKRFPKHTHFELQHLRNITEYSKQPRYLPRTRFIWALTESDSSIRRATSSVFVQGDVVRLQIVGKMAALTKSLQFGFPTFVETTMLLTKPFRRVTRSIPMLSRDIRPLLSFVPN